MDLPLTEDHLKSLIPKEWLVKEDPSSSVPYLFKFFFSRMDLSCVVLLTDTKTVWSEVLNSQQFARRWRSCNTNSPGPYSDDDEEDTWRETNLEALSGLHTLGGISEASFEVAQSKFSDLAVDLECEEFKWRWEANGVGYRLSAEIISKHLIFPLISANHLALTSAEPLAEMSDNDVEKAVDKIARTARRALGTHVKNAVSKPKTATVLRRVSAMLNFASDIPPVVSEAPKPELSIAKEVKRNPPAPPSPPPLVIREAFTDAAKSATVERTTITNTSLPRGPSPARSDTRVAKSPARPSSSAQPITGSETEDDTGDEEPVPDARVPKGKEKSSDGGGDIPMRSPSPPPPPKLSPPPTSSRESPPPPSNKQASKKPRLDSSSDSESDSATKAKPASRGGAVKRGARQPIKRGGKRF